MKRDSIVRKGLFVLPQQTKCGREFGTDSELPVAGVAGHRIETRESPFE